MPRTWGTIGGTKTVAWRARTASCLVGVGVELGDVEPLALQPHRLVAIKGQERELLRVEAREDRALLDVPGIHPSLR